MSYIKEIPQDTLSVDIDRIPTIYRPPETIKAAHVRGKVRLIIGNKGVELSTIIAHKIGMVIAKAVPTLEFNEMVVLSINNERIEMLKPIASRVSTALLIKADKADDWQLKIGAKQ